MLNAIWNFFFPPLTKRERKMFSNLDKLEKHGVRKRVRGRGTLVTEFDNDEARKWYYEQSFKTVPRKTP